MSSDGDGGYGGTGDSDLVSLLIEKRNPIN